MHVPQCSFALTLAKTECDPVDCSQKCEKTRPVFPKAAIARRNKLPRSAERARVYRIMAASPHGRDVAPDPGIFHARRRPSLPPREFRTVLGALSARPPE
jgi:hypothetical protein